MATPALPAWWPAIQAQIQPSMVDIGTAYYPRGIAPPGPLALGAGPGPAAFPMGAAAGPVYGPPMPMSGGTAAQRAVAALEAGGGSTASTARAAAQTRLAQAAAGTSGGAPMSMAQQAARQATSSPAFTGRGAAAVAPSLPGTGAAGTLAAEGAGIAGGGRLAGLLARGAPTWLTARLAGQSTAGLGLRSLAAGSLGRASLYGAAGQLGGMGVEALTGAQEGTWDDALRNGTVGMGIGAGLGSMVPVVGTAIGGGLGFIGGAAHGWLTGRGSKEGEEQRQYVKERDKFDDVFNAYGASPELRRNFLMQFNVASDGAGRSGVKEIAEQMRTMLPDLLMQDRAQVEDMRGREAMMAAAQAWMAPMMTDAQNRATRYGDELSQSMLASAETIPNDARRAFAIDEAKRIPLDIASQQAYAMQMMMSLPGLYGMQTQGQQSGVPAMDFQSIINATPIAQPGGGTTTMGALGQQQQPFALPQG